jgi:hypothetical protein
MRASCWIDTSQVKPGKKVGFLVSWYETKKPRNQEANPPNMDSNEQERMHTDMIGAKRMAWQTSFDR